MTKNVILNKYKNTKKKKKSIYDKFLMFLFHKNRK